MLSVDGTNDKIPPTRHCRGILWSLSVARQFVPQCSPKNLLCSRTTAKSGIGTNPGWGEPNTFWEGPEPEYPPSVGGTHGMTHGETD